MKLVNGKGDTTLAYTAAQLYRPFPTYKKTAWLPLLAQFR